MSEEKFLEACDEGDLETVRSLLVNKKININCIDILYQEHSLYSNLNFFIVLKN